MPEIDSKAILEGIARYGSQGGVNAKDYLTKLELAERLGITRRNVEEMMRRRMIPYLSFGHRTVRFFWPAVEGALAKFEHRAVGQERP